MHEDNKYGLILKRNDTEEKIVHVRSKSYLQNNEYIQKELENFVSSDEKNKRKVRCLCKDDHNLFFMVKKNSKNKYYIQNYSTNGVHDQECPFYIGETLFDDKTHKYSSKIFMDTDDFENQHINTTPNQYNETDRTTRRRLTYYNFCRDAIEDAMLRSFNSVNQGRTKRKDLENFSSDIFLDKLKFTVYNMTMNTKVPDGHKLVYGIINEHDNFFEKLDNDENEDILEVTADKYDTFKKVLQPKKFTIGRRRLRIARKLINNYGNDIHAPYLFIAVVLQGGKDEGKYRLPYIKRLFVHPIYFDNYHIAFVESGYERSYAKRLFEDEVAFLKPMSGNELYRITKELRNYEDNKDKKIEPKAPYIKYRPDFIVFYEDYLEIVEVSGYDNKEYKEDLKVKAKHYKKLEVETGIIRYKEIEGKKIE